MDEKREEEEEEDEKEGEEEETRQWVLSLRASGYRAKNR